MNVAMNIAMGTRPRGLLCAWSGKILLVNLRTGLLDLQGLLGLAILPEVGGH